MKLHPISHQKELFGSSRIRELQEQIRELDNSIERALKNNHYDKAKVMSDKQKSMIQELVELGDAEGKHPI
jgi:uncharacterized membrane protein (DUF106 family)